MGLPASLRVGVRSVFLPGEKQGLPRAEHTSDSSLLVHYPCMGDKVFQCMIHYSFAVIPQNFISSAGPKQVKFSFLSVVNLITFGGSFYV